MPIDFSVVSQAGWFGLPSLHCPFALVPIATFALVSFATIAEHLTPW